MRTNECSNAGGHLNSSDMKKLGNQTIKFAVPPSIGGFYSIAAKKEGEGPLRSYFDVVVDDSKYGEESWEKAESKFIKECVTNAIESAHLSVKDIEYVFGGDLMNQCISTNYAMREVGLPFFGLYGACSTMAESLSLAAMAVDGKFAKNVVAVTSSHFCSAERQFRYPLEYGGTRASSSQWTVTASGAVVLCDSGMGPYIKYVTTGKVIDWGIKDVNNMGAAMAPAAADTIITHFSDTGKTFDDYDLVVTGDLGSIGKEVLIDLLKDNAYDPKGKLNDCGVMIFDLEEQDVHAGGSGCGCSASVLAGYLLKEMKKGTFRNILLVSTGALMSPLTTQQGETIPGIAHLVAISTNKEAK